MNSCFLSSQTRYAETFHSYSRKPINFSILHSLEHISTRDFWRTMDLKHKYAEREGPKNLMENKDLYNEGAWYRKLVRCRVMLQHLVTKEQGKALTSYGKALTSYRKPLTSGHKQTCKNTTKTSSPACQNYVTPRKRNKLMDIRQSHPITNHYNLQVK